MSFSFLLTGLFGLVGLLGPGIAIDTGHAKTVEVKMLNKDPEGELMVFSPEVVFVDVGDTVLFKSVDKGHSVASMNEAGSTPKGAPSWGSKISQDHLQTFTQEGVHGIICKPHLPMGMIGAVVVGRPLNLEEFKKVSLKGKAKVRFPRIIKSIESKAGK